MTGQTIGRADMRELDSYAIALRQRAVARISTVLTDAEAGAVSARAFQAHATSRRSLRFQRYYIETVANTQAFLQSPGFFATFSARYGLRGIDSAYLDGLEQAKPTILRRIEDGDLVGVYLEFFATAGVRRSRQTVEKNLGSFFTKLVHTLRPTEYCALDNPVKEYLGLRHEGFFVAFVVLSAAYREWARQRALLMTEVRKACASTETLGDLSREMTDLKLLDLVFWQLADSQRRALSQRRGQD
jgi:hypothetical protein